MAAGRTFIDQLLGKEITELNQEPRFNPQPKPKKAKAKPSYEGGPTQAQIAAWEKDYMAGTEVIHKQFGQGYIVGRMGSIALIAFDDYGTKRIELPTCLQGPDQAVGAVTHSPTMDQMYIGAVRVNTRQANRITGPVHSNWFLCL